MSRKTLFILICLAAVISLLALVLAPQSSDDPPGADVLPTIDVNAVPSLTIRDAEGRVALSRSADGWQMPDVPGIPVDGGKIRALLISLSQLTVEALKTDNPAYHGAVGLDETGVTIEIAPGKGVILGKSAAGGGRFARAIGQDQSVVVTAITPPASNAKAWTTLTLPTVAKDDVTRVDVSGVGAPYSVIKGDDGWALEPLGDNEALAYDTVLETVAGAASFIDFTDIRLAEPMDWAEPASAVFRGAEGSVTYLVIQDKEGGSWLKIAPSVADDIDWGRYAFEISQYRRDSLVKPRAQLLARAEGDE